MAKKLTSKKAQKILHDKEVYGKPLTEKQRKFFGAIAGGAEPYKAQGGLSFLQPNNPKLPIGVNPRETVIPFKPATSTEYATSIGGEGGQPAYLIPGFKYGRPLSDPEGEFMRTGEYLGGPFKTWQEADEWERTVRHPYVEQGKPIPSPIRTKGKEYKKGGAIPKAQGGKTTGKEDRVYTYKKDRNWFDNRSTLWGEDYRWNDLVREKVYQGTHGFNPVTGALVLLEKDQRISVDKGTQALAKDKRTLTESEKKAASKKLQQEKTEEWVAESMKDVVKNPLTYAPAAIATGALAAPYVASQLPILGAALNTTIGGVPGLTTSNLLWATGAGLSANEAFNPSSTTRQSINTAIQNPTLQNITDAAGYSLGTGLGFYGLPYRQGLSSIKEGIKSSQETGILSNAYKLNPWGVKTNPEMHLYRARPVGQNIDMNMAAEFKAKQAQGIPLKWNEQAVIDIVEGRKSNAANILEREKYFGRWFEEDPSRLDFYLNPETRNFAENAELEILRAKLPKSEAAKFNVSQFEDAKMLTASPKTEYILPKEVVESAEKFPGYSWQRLINEDKAFNKPHWLRGYKDVTPKLNQSTSFPLLGEDLNQMFQYINPKNLKVQSGLEWMKNWYGSPDFFRRNSVQFGNYPLSLDEATYFSDQKQGRILESLEKYQPKNYFNLLKDKGLATYLSHSPVTGGVSYGTPTGIYVNRTSYLPFNRKGLESTRTHELTHLIEDNGWTLNPNEQSALLKPFGYSSYAEMANKNPEVSFWRQILGNRSRYYLEPTEIHARMNEARYNLGLRPEDKFTPQMFDKIKKEHGWFGMGKLIKDKQAFIDLMNNFWAVPPAVGVGMAASTEGNIPEKKYGGGIPKAQPGLRGEVTYSHVPKPTYHGTNDPAGDYMLRRTVTPYKTRRQIKKNTGVPSSPSEVNFISNYAGAIGSPLSEGFEWPTSVPYEGAKHWNIDRFIIDPQFGDSYPSLRNEESTKRQMKMNTLSDMYKYFMLQNPEDKKGAWKQAKKFMRTEVNPRVKGAVYDDYIRGNLGSIVPNITGLTSVVTPDYLAKYQNVKESVSSPYQDRFTERFKEDPMSPRQVKRVGMDWLMNYKGMSRKEAREYLKSTENKQMGGKVRKAQSYLNVRPSSMMPLNQSVTQPVYSSIPNPSLSGRTAINIFQDKQNETEKELGKATKAAEDFMLNWSLSPMHNQMAKESHKNWKENFGSDDESKLNYLNRLHNLRNAITSDFLWYASSNLGEHTQGEHESDSRIPERSLIRIKKGLNDAEKEGVAIHELSHATDVRDGILPWDVYKMKDFSSDYASQFPEKKSYTAEEESSRNYRNYIADPTETRARLNNIRFDAKKAGIYDPFTEKLDEDKFEKLMDFYIHSPDSNNTPYFELRDAYSPSQIFNMLNSISKNDSKKGEVSQAKGGMEIIADDGKDIVMPFDGPYASAPDGYEGLGYSSEGYNYNPAWGGRWQGGGALPGMGGTMYARTGQDWKPKNISQDGSEIEGEEVIEDDMGQWAHPGEITKINSNEITMEGVPYPVLGVSDTGDAKVMMPGEENIEFEGTSVTEYPLDGEEQNQPKPKTELEKVLESTSKYDKGATFKSLVGEVAKSSNISASWLFGSAFTEGMNIAALNPKMVSEGYLKAIENGVSFKGYPVDGFYNYGLDRFAENFKEFVKKGYLPSDFDFKPYKAVNELGEVVNTAAFKNNKDALKAKAAFLKHERDNIRKVAKNLGVKLSPEEEQFFAMASYNSPLGAQNMLKEIAKEKINPTSYILDKTRKRGQVYKNIMPRYRMMMALAGQFAFGGTIQDRGQLKKLDQLTNFTNYNRYD